MAKPNLLKETVEEIIKANKIDRTKNPVVLVGIRGFDLDYGVRGKNDIGVYDDALFWVTPTGFYAVNGNTDPSRIRKGRGKGDGKGMAHLNPGVWTYKMGIHYGSYQHPAFRQAAVVTVTRDGVDGDYLDEGMFGINIHRGGNNGTSSLGCQTIPVPQWEAFKTFGYTELKRYKQETFPYILIEESARRTGKLKVA